MTSSGGWPGGLSEPETGLNKKPFPTVMQQTATSRSRYLAHPGGVSRRGQIPVRLFDRICDSSSMEQKRGALEHPWNKTRGFMGFIQQLAGVRVTESTFGAGDGNRTHVRKLGSCRHLASEAISKWQNQGGGFGALQAPATIRGRQSWYWLPRARLKSLPSESQFPFAI
jgi:hypothetical protein